MDVVIAFQINDLISRGASILNGLEAELQQLGAPGADVARDLIGEAAGQLAAEFFGTRKAKGYGKKATRAWLDSQRRDATKAITAKYYQQYFAWFQETCQFVSGVSVSRNVLVFPGNSGPLLRNLKRAEGFKRLETRIRHAVTVLEELRAHDLVLNISLPKQLPRAEANMFDPAQALQRLENTLRRFIERELSRSGADWWTHRVPSEIRSRAEGRMHRQELVWPWHLVSSTNVMDYLDFSDYRKIILEPTNWSQIFVSFFKSQSFVDSRMGELEPIRNDLAHSRPLSAMAKDKMRLYIEELEKCIGRSGRGV